MEILYIIGLFGDNYFWIVSLELFLLIISRNDMEIFIVFLCNKIHKDATCIKPYIFHVENHTNLRKPYSRKPFGLRVLD